MWSENIEEETLKNKFWRKVLNTGPNIQTVVMSVPKGQELGWEVHKDSDQFFRIEKGSGVIMTRKKNVKKTEILSDGIAAVVPKGTWHNIINTGKGPLKFYTIYSPPHHPPNTIDKTHKDELKREKTK